MPAPGAALVFLSQTAQDESYNPSVTQTFPTTYYSQGGPTVDAAVLETSNGRGGPNEKQHPLGATSHGDNQDNAMRRSIDAGRVSLMLTAAAMALGTGLVGKMLATLDY